jgi:hypothetical protein
MKAPQTPPKTGPAEAARATREAAEAAALRKNLQRRKAQARTKQVPEAPEKDDKCP